MIPEKNETLEEVVEKYIRPMWGNESAKLALEGKLSLDFFPDRIEAGDMSQQEFEDAYFSGKLKK